MWKLDGMTVIDEAQKAPSLFPTIKRRVDADPSRAGSLTGSANILLLPKMSESLAGRMEIATLWPFAENWPVAGSGSSTRHSLMDRG